MIAIIVRGDMYLMLHKKVAVEKESNIQLVTVDDDTGKRRKNN